MNVQVKVDKASGKIISRGIEWTDFTWNPVGGCFHECEWIMPDGTRAKCYAKAVALVMTNAYPNGFEHSYWRPAMLNEPLSQTTPSRIFMDSMSDLMGHWVPREQVLEVMATCVKADWHTFQLLTKNAPNLLNFDLPRNVHAGVSAPPTFMNGKQLTPEQQKAMVFKQLDVLQKLKERGQPVCWMSIEPLSFDIGDVFISWMDDRSRPSLPLNWAVIGAASNGRKYFQPESWITKKLHTILRREGVRIFHKGNLKWDPHLEEFPCPA